MWYEQYLPDRTRGADGKTGGGANLALKRDQKGGISDSKKV
jgi:hypothetical protein